MSELADPVRGQYTAYKAVSKRPDGYYTLGMGPAQIIPLAPGQWIDGGQYGFAATTTISEAKRVINDAQRRKVLPIPPAMTVIKIQLKGIIESKNGRLTATYLRLLDEADDNAH